jgi:predicted PurR-regulated permease PerM
MGVLRGDFVEHPKYAGRRIFSSGINLTRLYHGKISYLFYLLRDRSAVLESLRAVSPLSKEDMNQLLGEIHETVRTTVYGTFAVAAVQGVLGGLMFWWLGLAEPLLWGVVMGLLGVVPVLGAFVIWIPAAIFLALEGSGWKAMLLVIWGTIVVGGIDNLLYPMIVGQRLKLHSILALVSILGGLIVLGPSGLILGPVTFTVTRVLLEIWGRRNEASSA